MTTLDRNSLFAFSREPLLWLFLAAVLSFGSVLSLLFHISLILPLLLIGAILMILFLFRSPQSLLFSLIVVRMSLDYSAQFYTFTIQNISLSLSQLLGVGIALLGIMLLILKRRSLATFPLNTAFAIIFLWGIATLSYSLYPKNSLQELLRIFDLFVLGFLAFIAIKDQRSFQRLLLAFFASSVLPILFGLYQFIFGIGLQDENVSVLRIFGTFSHPNVYSLYLFSLVVFGTLYLLLFAQKVRSQMLTLTLLGIFTVMLLLTFARVAWVALFLFVFLLALFRFRLLLFPLILIPFVLFVFSSSFQARVNESFTLDPDSSIVWRQTLWHDVTRYSIQEGHLIFGSGMDTFPKVSESVRGTKNGPNDPHNDFVKFFIEGGIVGIIIFIAYLLSLLALLITHYRKNKKEMVLHLSFGVMILFFFTLELSSLTDNVFKNTPVQWIFFTVFGALLSLSQKNHQEPLIKDSPLGQ